MTAQPSGDNQPTHSPEDDRSLPYWVKVCGLLALLMLIAAVFAHLILGGGPGMHGP